MKKKCLNKYSDESALDQYDKLITLMYKLNIIKPSQVLKFRVYLQQQRIDLLLRSMAEEVNKDMWVSKGTGYPLPEFTGLLDQLSLPKDP
jgi:hypothetical protein